MDTAPRCISVNIDIGSPSSTSRTLPNDTVLTATSPRHPPSSDHYQPLTPTSPGLVNTKAQTPPYHQDNNNFVIRNSSNAMATVRGKTDPAMAPYLCARCNKKIVDRYLLEALDKYWHEDCLKVRI